MSSVTLPGRNAAPPVTCLMAAASASGVASAANGSTVTAAALARNTRRPIVAPSAAEGPLFRRPQKRSLDFASLKRGYDPRDSGRRDFMSLLQGREIGHHV